MIYMVVNFTFYMHNCFACICLHSITVKAVSNVSIKKSEFAQHSAYGESWFIVQYNVYWTVRD
jgi:hypothetical protein